jgi:hypothetical protein
VTIRAYHPDDFPIVSAWAAARNVEIAPVILSPNGFLIEDDRGPLAVCWSYLVFDVPIAIIDNFITRPNTSLKQAKDAWRMLFRAVRSFLGNLRDCNGKPLGYNLIRTFCHSSLAKFMESEGWQVSSTQYVQISILK